jgi:hypothetical protein
MELARSQCGQIKTSFVVSCYVSKRNRSTEVLEAHNNVKSEFARPLTPANVLLKPLARGFVRNLKWANTPVNEKNGVLLLTVGKPKKRRHPVPTFRAGYAFRLSLMK